MKAEKKQRKISRVYKKVVLRIKKILKKEQFNLKFKLRKERNRINTGIFERMSKNYAFEPERNVFLELKDNTKSLNNIIYYNAGLWNETTELGFATDTNQTQGAIQPFGDEEIKSLSI